MGGTSLTVLDSKGTQKPLQLESKIHIVLSQNVESIVSAMKVTVSMCYKRRASKYIHV
jgi:hypothetical protein